MVEQAKDGSLKELFLKIMQKRQSTEALSQMQYMPEGEYQHKTLIMLNKEDKKIEDIPAFLSKELSIANITDDFALYIAGERLNLVLMSLFQTMLRIKEMHDKEKDKHTKALRKQEFDTVKEIFESQMIPYLGTLKLTRAKDGMERKLQGNMPLDEKQAKRGFALPKFGQKKEDNSGDIQYA